MLRQRAVIDAGLVVIRLRDSNLAERVVAFLNSERGQSLRALLVSGVTIPHFGPRALRDLRIPTDVLDRRSEFELVHESVGSLSTELDGLLWT